MIFIATVLGILVYASVGIIIGVIARSRFWYDELLAVMAGILWPLTVAIFCLNYVFGVIEKIFVAWYNGLCYLAEKIDDILP